MPEFWRSSGYDLLDRRDDGMLAVTDDFLRAYLARPEMAPPPEACKAERALHAQLLEAPRRVVTPVHIVALKDSDARENYQIWLRYRDWLVKHGTAEAAYLALFRAGSVSIPPMFVDHLAAAILRAILDGTEDAFRARAAECLFRTQSVSVADGSVMAADEETVEMHAKTGGLGDLGRLVVEAGTRPRTAELDVLTPENAGAYWARSDRHDMVLDLSFTRPGLDALARVLESWIAHFLGVATAIQPVQSVRDEKWRWHVGLDPEASAIMNDLYEGRAVAPEREARVLSLFRLEFKDAATALPEMAGRPVYLAMAANARQRLRIKPQNLLVNLPIRPAS